jgi:hypothetical protein
MTEQRSRSGAGPQPLKPERIQARSEAAGTTEVDRRWAALMGLDDAEVERLLARRGRSLTDAEAEELAPGWTVVEEYGARWLSSAFDFPAVEAASLFTSYLFATIQMTDWWIALNLTLGADGGVRVRLTDAKPATLSGRAALVARLASAGFRIDGERTPAARSERVRSPPEGGQAMIPRASDGAPAGAPLTAEQVRAQLALLPGWALLPGGTGFFCDFPFSTFDGAALFFCCFSALASHLPIGLDWELDMIGDRVAVALGPAELPMSAELFLLARVGTEMARRNHLVGAEP